MRTSSPARMTGQPRSWGSVGGTEAFKPFLDEGIESGQHCFQSAIREVRSASARDSANDFSKKRCCILLWTVGNSHRWGKMSFSNLATRPLKQRSRAVRLILATLLGAAFAVDPLGSQTTSNPRQFLDTYCVTCHNQKLRTAGLELDRLDAANPGANAEVWERVIGKLRAGSMPPPGMPRPDAATYRAVASSLESEIDRAWAASPNPGRSQRGPSSQSRGIQERDSRPVRARSRCEAAAAGRRDRRRQFRQLRGCPLDFDGPSGALHVGGPPGHAARDGSSSRQPERSRDSKSRCTCCRTTGRAKTCRSDPAAASRFATTFPSTASTSSKFVCRGSIRITSRAWAGRSSSTFAWMASC